MARYFFDFRTDDAFMPDEEGADLSDAETAHEEAIDALAHAIRDGALEGSGQQRFAVEVRDELGQVLEVTAIFGSRILRKQ
jgi:hypothetical protein